MLTNQKKYKGKVIKKYFIQFCVWGMLYLITQKLFMNVCQSKKWLVLICKLMNDMALIFSVTICFSFIVLLINYSYDSLIGRGKTYVVQIVCLAVLIFLFKLENYQTEIWIDIILIVFFVLVMIIRDNSYLNEQQVIGLSQIVDFTYVEYTEKYEEIIQKTATLNKKAEVLLEVRLKNAQDQKNRKKAEKDKISYVVSDKMKPDNYYFPVAPEKDTYSGILGLFIGKQTINHYEESVSGYIRALEKAYKRIEKRDRKLEVDQNNIDNAIKYIEGTPSDELFEQITGISIDKSEKVRKSYNIFKKKKFRKTIKF